MRDLPLRRLVAILLFAICSMTSAFALSCAESLESPRFNAANSAGRTFYTVQGEANAGRLLSGGTPWPTAPAKAHLGEGLYTWGSRSQAESYMSLLEGRGASGLRIMEASIPEAQYNALRAMDLRGLGDEAANAWLGRHSSLFGESAPHGLNHVIRDTGNFGPEFFFSKDAFPLLQLK